MKNNKKVSILDLLKQNSKTYQLGTQGVTQEISGLKAKDWKDEIIYNGEVNRKFSQMVENDYTLTTQQGNSLILGIVKDTLELRTTVPVQTGTTPNKLELTRMNEVIIDKEITVEDGDWYGAEIAVTFQDAVNARVDKMKLAKYFLQEQLTDIPDKMLAKALQDTSVTQRVYGGTGKTSVATLQNGDTLTPKLFANAMLKVEDSGYVPYCFLCSPAQANAMRKDSQFTDASQLGTTDVIKTGIIQNFLGVPFIVSTNCPQYLATNQDINETGANSHWGTAGNTGILISKRKSGQKCSGGIFWKQKGKIDYIQNVEEMLHKFTLIMAFKCTLLQPTSICLVKTSKV